ncbi:MAG: undecaprenyl-phosphate glucose phosphotransferase [Lachnospiraceae bacterium]|nr:undecaprenyl-phosphate glucose phosphotransferase [Lachnospiraceae bacterium]
MIRNAQGFLNRVHVVLDGAVTALSYFIAYEIRFETSLNDPTIPHLPMYMYMWAQPFLIIAYIFLYNQFGLYRSKRLGGRRREFVNIIYANIVGFIGFVSVLYVINQTDFARSMLVIFAVVNILLETLMRNIIRYVLHFIRKKGYNKKYLLMIGYSKSAEEYIRRIRLNPHWGYEVCGILDDRVPAGTMLRGVKVLGRIANLDVILPENKIVEIAITLPLDEYSKLERIVAKCEKSGVHTQFIPDYNRVIPSRPIMEDVEGLPVINIRNVPLTATENRFIKRTMDIVGAILMLIVFSPVMLASAIAVRLSSKGPVIYKQERVGLHNKTFMMYKFRTMEMQKESEEKKGWTVKDDPRVTKAGKVLRRTSMDELPQLFNILKGDMSIVGPRPERPQFVEKFKEEIPRYMVKHQVRPGLTGWAQVNGLRGDTSIKDRIKYDIYYIENWSVLFDIRIMFMTAFRGLINQNAY